MADNQNPNPNDPPTVIISDDEEPRLDYLFDEDWLKDPLDPFYRGPKPEIPPEFASSSFDSIDIDQLVEQVRTDTFDRVGTIGTVGMAGAVGTVGIVGAVGTVGSVFGGGGVIDWKAKEKEKERVEEIQREKWKSEMSHARSLLMERRRTRKLNENIMKLRAAVPKISNMDRMSTLCDAIDYIKELTQRIQDLQNEIEPGGSSSSSSINQPPEHYSIPQFEYLGSQSAFVDVRIFENGKIYIHMFCKHNPTLMPSIIRALELLNLDIENAYFGSLTSFVLDVFCFKQTDDKPAWKPEDIKSLLLACIGEGNETNNLKF